MKSNRTRTTVFLLHNLLNRLYLSVKLLIIIYLILSHLCVSSIPTVPIFMHLLSLSHSGSLKRLLFKILSFSNQKNKLIKTCESDLFRALYHSKMTNEENDYLRHVTTKGPISTFSHIPGFVKNC